MENGFNMKNVENLWGERHSQEKHNINLEVRKHQSCHCFILFVLLLITHLAETIK